MFKVNKKQREIRPIKLGKAALLNDEEMKSAYGSGNSQIRYIPNEYVQSKLLQDKATK
ncbi:hypothetical protein SAMN02745116_00240 [Pilibacter termitis]|uniref:Uncharacterized protein n=1 Tax=Pilibacter termitis TaxID=263852 RepID=A0A1T4KG37_9ENTE|nr:hypothetical protein [Pilibacter termitis]SJZ41408.1 hypothetical protein SAMN02745116_00240 [Pilibacter termitis]